MVIADRLVYLELQKTGCTHIRTLLQQLVGGELVGRHNRAPRTLLDGQRLLIGSIRNPWDWYVSLWSYGCDRRGSLFARTTRTPAAQRWWALLPGQGPSWADTYADSRDPRRFRQWLQLVHGRRTMAAIGEGYARSPVSQVAGLLTYRFLKLFCTHKGQARALRHCTSLQAIERFAARRCFIDAFIRTETLEADLLRILQAHGVVPDAQRWLELSNRPPTNPSSRSGSTGHYYDAASLALVAERDQMIIRRFHYTPPLP